MTSFPAGPQWLAIEDPVWCSYPDPESKSNVTLAIIEDPVWCSYPDPESKSNVTLAICKAMEMVSRRLGFWSCRICSPSEKKICAPLFWSLILQSLVCRLHVRKVFQIHYYSAHSKKNFVTIESIYTSSRPVFTGIPRSALGLAEWRVWVSTCQWSRVERQQDEPRTQNPEPWIPICEPHLTYPGNQVTFAIFNEYAAAAHLNRRTRTIYAYLGRISICWFIQQKPIIQVCVPIDLLIPGTWHTRHPIQLLRESAVRLVLNLCHLLALKRVSCCPMLTYAPASR